MSIAFLSRHLPYDEPNRASRCMIGARVRASSRFGYLSPKPAGELMKILLQDAGPHTGRQRLEELGNTVLAMMDYQNTATFVISLDVEEMHCIK